MINTIQTTNTAREKNTKSVALKMLVVVASSQLLMKLDECRTKLGITDAAWCCTKAEKKVNTYY